MESKESVRARVIQHLVDASDAKVTAGEVTDETLLQENLALDSLQAVSLMLDLEEAFQITVETDELASVRTVKDLLQMIETKRTAQQSI
ncbi:MAG: acyl carrier protein [Vicinamibacterales bacterium]